jgi:hypothetical protein
MSMLRSYGEPEYVQCVLTRLSCWIVTCMMCSVQASPLAASSVTDSTDLEAEATLAELRSTTQRSEQEVVNVGSPHLTFSSMSFPSSCLWLM